MKVILSKQELENELETQLRFLCEHCAQFDRGDFPKVKLIASGLRKLLHDKKPNSNSLLGQLNFKNKFLDTSRTFDNPKFRKGEIFFVHNLIENSVHSWKPVFNESSENIMIDFDKWWADIVIKDFEGQEFSRKDLIHFFCRPRWRRSC